MCTETPQRLRQLTACTVMILFVFKTDQDKRALKYKFDEEKLSDFFPPLCWFPVKSVESGAGTAVWLHSREGTPLLHGRELAAVWNCSWAATAETSLDWFFPVLGWGLEWDGLISALVEVLL